MLLNQQLPEIELNTRQMFALPPKIGEISRQLPRDGQCRAVAFLGFFGPAVIPEHASELEVYVRHEMAAPPVSGIFRNDSLLNCQGLPESFLRPLGPLPCDEQFA